MNGLSLEGAIDRFRAFVTECGVGSAIRPTLNEIASAERRLGVKVPDDLAQLLWASGGTDADAICDVDPLRHIHFWAVRDLRVVSEAEAGRWAPAVAFADHMLNSVEFALPLRGGGVISLNGPGSRLVAPSLAAFLDRYVADDPQIFG